MKNYLLVILFAGILAYACVADISEDAGAQLPGQEEVARSTHFWTDLERYTTGQYPSTEFPETADLVIWHKAIYATAVGRAITSGTVPAWDVYSGLYFGWHVMCEELLKTNATSRSTESLTPEQAEAMVREAIAADPEQFALLAEELRQAVNIDYINSPSDLYDFAFYLIDNSFSFIQNIIAPSGFTLANTPKSLRRQVIFRLMNMSGLEGGDNLPAAVAEMNEGELFLEEALDYLWNNNWQILKPLRGEFAFMDGIMYLRHYSQYSGLLYDLSRVLEYVLPVLPRTAYSQALGSRGPFRTNICEHYWDTGEFTREDFSVLMMSVFNASITSYYFHRAIFPVPVTTPASGSTQVIPPYHLGGQYKIQVSAKGPWTASVTGSPQFMSIVSGGSATGDGTITLNYSKNTGAARTNSVDIRYEMPGTGLTRTSTIKYQQEAGPGDLTLYAFADNYRSKLTLYPYSISGTISGIPNTGGELLLVVNTPSDADGWSFIVPTTERFPFYSLGIGRNGKGDGPLFMYVNPNTTGTERTSKLTLYYKSWEYTINLRQNGR